MRRSIIGPTLTALGLFVSINSAHAGTLFDAVLNGSQEVPPNASPATGFGLFELNDAETELAFEISYGDLLTGLTVAHFHRGAVGVNGPVVRGISVAEGAIPGTTSGLMSGIWKSTDASPLTPALVADLKAGLIYVNLHTSLFPGGEIRGQIFAVPEPSAIVLSGLGLAVVTVIARRRRAAVS